MPFTGHGVVWEQIYGAQPPIEILRQWMDHAGWYNRDENVYVNLVDIQFVAAMGPPGKVAYRDGGYRMAILSLA